MRILVTGAGGFIGHHLVSRLRADGHWVLGVDRKAPEYETTHANEFFRTDLRRCESLNLGTIDQVFHLAAEMGGIGFISAHHYDICRDSTRMTLNVLHAAMQCSPKPRVLFTSSACVYPAHAQQSPRGSWEGMGLREESAWPADPEPGYGLEKLYGEKLFEYAHRDHGLDVRIARFHNIYGPLGTWEGGREKAPAAIARKVAECPSGGQIEVWGDGQQTRSFCYVDDAVEGLIRLMASDVTAPVNVGSEELVTVDELVELTATVAGKAIYIRHDLTKPQGVRGRNSDNERCRKLLGWEPRTTLRDGMATVYPWVRAQLGARAR